MFMYMTPDVNDAIAPDDGISARRHIGASCVYSGAALLSMQNNVAAGVNLWNR